MFQAEIHLDQEKSCVLDEFAEQFDVSFDVAIEELHDHLVTFVMELENQDEVYESYLRESPQVRHVERLDEANYLVTKTSCGAYAAVDQNHGILRRQSLVSPARRVYRVLFFRREDLRAIIDGFRAIGTVSLGNVSEFDQSVSRLTDRQREVVSYALGAGYFEWPRRATSDEIATAMGISRATFLEHLRKGEAKLLEDALDGDGIGPQTGSHSEGPTEETDGPTGPDASPSNRG